VVLDASLEQVAADLADEGVQLFRALVAEIVSLSHS
jgi:hypothetical protein